ncbi:MAG: hypothetical protein JWM53_2147 [bacterium]|nr:hypothetical protein [bacterium]
MSAPVHDITRDERDDAELVPSAAGPLELVDESLFFEGGATPITVCHWYSVYAIER